MNKKNSKGCTRPFTDLLFYGKLLVYNELKKRRLTEPPFRIELYLGLVFANRCRAALSYYIQFGTPQVFYRGTSPCIYL